jgi:hypothetical protein
MHIALRTQDAISQSHQLTINLESRPCQVCGVELSFVDTDGLPESVDFSQKVVVGLYLRTKEVWKESLSPVCFSPRPLREPYKMLFGSGVKFDAFGDNGERSDSS